ncbi:MAG: transposase [Alphaproteobacteria bacterium]|nr:transposase [Alphaproteobacteria bacterium]
MDMSGDDFDRRFDVVADTRRRWSLAEKRKIVAEACVPCANISAVARRHGLKPALLYRWKKELGGERQDPSEGAGFVPVTITAVATSKPAGAPPPVTVNDRHSVIDIRLANGRSVRVDASIETSTLRHIINALES